MKATALYQYCVRIFLCCALLTTLTGCIDMFNSTAPQSGGRAVPQPQSPLDEARNALARGDYAKAEVLAQSYSQGSGKSNQDAAAASQILAIAATNNQHPHVAFTALERWRTVSPGVDATKNWQDVWCLAMSKLPPRESRNHANDLYRDTARSPQMRGVAGVYLAVRQWGDGEMGESLATLESMYGAAGGVQGKALLEGRLATQLSLAPSAATFAASSVTPENQTRFPYNIIRIDQLRRESQNPTTRSAAQSSLSAFSREVKLADPGLLNGPPPASEPLAPAASGPTPTAGTVDSGPISGRPIVLALPLSGQFGNIAAKIAAGADIACKEMSSGGNVFSLVVIDTDQPDWAARINGLPANATMVGGPLRTSDYTTAKSQGLIGKRAFFAFMPTLDGSDEGRVAWRFFASPLDQVNALLAFTTSLGIKGYAALYPDEPYGQRMAHLFDERAHSMGAEVHTGSYPPRDTSSWLRSVGNLLAANKNSAHGSTATFQAIFLPDSWKNMDVIVPNIFYYNETRQVLLGTTLWEQGLSGQALSSPQYYGLAVFPGSWNPSASTPATERLRSLMQSSGKGQADVWAGIGYDFARFAGNLGIREGWSASSINAALQSVSIPWSIGPIRWDGSGKAEEQLFLFTPSTSGGMIPLDEPAFRKNFASVWK